MLAMVLVWSRERRCRTCTTMGDIGGGVGVIVGGGGHLVVFMVLLQ